MPRNYSMISHLFSYYQITCCPAVFLQADYTVIYHHLIDQCHYMSDFGVVGHFSNRFDVTSENWNDFGNDLSNLTQKVLIHFFWEFQGNIFGVVIFF